MKKHSKNAIIGFFSAEHKYMKPFFGQILGQISYRNNKQVLAGLFSLLLASILYFFLGNYRELSAWRQHGATHYQLMVDYEKLGGIDGMITRIKTKLTQNPNDKNNKEGWLILGKLYRAKGQKTLASDALNHANKLYR